MATTKLTKEEYNELVQNSSSNTANSPSFEELEMQGGGVFLIGPKLNKELPRADLNTYSPDALKSNVSTFGSDFRVYNKSDPLKSALNESTRVVQNILGKLPFGETLSEHFPAAAKFTLGAVGVFDSAVRIALLPVNFLGGQAIKITDKFELTEPIANAFTEAKEGFYSILDKGKAAVFTAAAKTMGLGKHLDAFGLGDLFGASADNALEKANAIRKNLEETNLGKQFNFAELNTGLGTLQDEIEEVLQTNTDGPLMGTPFFDDQPELLDLTLEEVLGIEPKPQAEQVPLPGEEQIKPDKE